jgi:hypothetical protein
VTNTSDLVRFWFPVPGHIGIGVTAPSLAEATELATEVALELGWTFDPREAEQNVDPAHLDPHRVLPEILNTLERGVWFPRRTI